MVIRKAVIPAAGLGTRFLPVTKSMPKEMLPIIDKPVIHYVIEEAISAGIEDILIITGKGKRAIEDYFDKSLELEDHLSTQNKFDLLEKIRDISSLVDIHYIRQKSPKGLGDAVLKAEKHVGGEPFAVLLGDDIIVSKVPAIKQLIDLFTKVNNPVVGVEQVPLKDVQKYGIIEDEHGIVTKMIEKPVKTSSRHAIIGRYLLTPEIFDCIRSIEPGYGGEIQLTDALIKLMENRQIFIKKIEGKRYDMGDTLNYITAIIDFSLKREDLKPWVYQYISHLVGSQ